MEEDIVRKLCSDSCNMYIRKLWLGIKTDVL